MKTLIASVFALTLLGTTAASADLLGVGVHIGGVGADAHIGGGYHHHRHCHGWGYHHHHRFCRGWY
jgi:hypothetical protein